MHDTDKIQGVFANRLLEHSLSVCTDNFSLQHDTEPYRYFKVNNFINNDLLTSVRDELQNISATRKETDIYRVFQTGDLANLDGLPDHEKAVLKNLMVLRNGLYSEEFREWVRKITGVKGRLSPSKKDLSVNHYREGCHLLCHDDVIGSRSVSFIIYLTDPQNPWKPEEGGALELYDVIEKGTPAVHPSKVIDVEWNQMVLFEVQPGHSFHSVAEVFSPHRDRLSISGWFHVLQEDDMSPSEIADYRAKKLKQDEDNNQNAKASMDQLFEEDKEYPFHPLPQILPASQDDPDLQLTDDDITFLKPFINPLYLNGKVLAQANQKFCDESSIQLQDFLHPELADSIQTATTKQDNKCGFLHPRPHPRPTPTPADYTLGVHGAWFAQGPSHKQRFLTLPATLPAGMDPTDPSHLFSTLQHTLFSSKPFRRLLAAITSLTTVAARSKVRRFRPGMDYTLATPTVVPRLTLDRNVRVAPFVLDATLCFCADEGARGTRWQSDEYGGFECYMAADDGNDDPAQYRGAGNGYGRPEQEDEDDNVGDGGALLNVSCGRNILTIVMREEGVMGFVKYISGAADGSRWDLSFEYLVTGDDVDGS